ncbi:MAG: cupin domain-containing protein [Actinobacteria bacterium]|nr:cupin domain-containing protein [Actinomycetota bacterium]
MDFEQALLEQGFRPGTGRSQRGVRPFVAEPNPYLTYTVLVQDDGTALFTWEFAVGEYLRTKGIQFGSDETLNQFMFPREDDRGPQDGDWLHQAVERARDQLGSLRFPAAAEDEERADARVRVVEASEHDALAWEVIPTEEGDPDPPGEEVVVFRAGDARFSFGLWRRAPETGPMEPPYHEIAVLIEGEVEVTDRDGTVHRAGPGDVLVTPKGTKATWQALAPVKKFWAIYKER